MTKVKFLKLKPLLKEMRKDDRVAIIFNYHYGKTDFSVVFYDFDPMVLTFLKKYQNIKTLINMTTTKTHSITRVMFKLKMKRKLYT